METYMSEEELQELYEKENVSMSRIDNLITDHIVFRVKRGGYYVERSVPYEYYLHPSFGLPFKVMLREMISELNEITGERP